MPVTSGVGFGACASGSFFAPVIFALVVFVPVLVRWGLFAAGESLRE